MTTDLPRHDGTGPADDRRGLTIPQFCQRYAVGRTYASNLLKDGEIEAVKAGARTIITVDSAERWFASLKPMKAVA